MPRENIYNAIILKKSPYGEGDEILTLFTESAGKVRALAKSVKFQKSKLQYSLQACFLVKVTLTSSPLPKLIGAEVLNAFPAIRENLEAAKMAFYALETALKGTPDEQPNGHLYYTLCEFFTFLDLCKTHGDLLLTGLAKFKIEFLDALGLSIHLPYNLDRADLYLGFSPGRGGFTPHNFSNEKNREGFISGEDAADFITVLPETIDQFTVIRETAFSQLAQRQNLPQAIKADSTQPLNDLLSRFINYQLEREIRSEEYLQ